MKVAFHLGDRQPLVEFGQPVLDDVNRADDQHSLALCDPQEDLREGDDLNDQLRAINPRGNSLESSCPTPSSGRGCNRSPRSGQSRGSIRSRCRT